MLHVHAYENVFYNNYSKWYEGNKEINLRKEVIFNYVNRYIFIIPDSQILTYGGDPFF
jgi:hypothetical protein